MQSFQLQLSRSPLPSGIQNPCNLTLPFGPRHHHSIEQTLLPPKDYFSEVKTSLHICIEQRNPKQGYSVHAKTLKFGLQNNVYIANSLLDMYAKCGQIDDAAKLFDHMPERTVVSWTSMISAYHPKGLGFEAIELFLVMLDILQPNEHTLAVILQVCATKGDGILVQAIHCYAIKCGSISDNFLLNSLIDAYAKSGLLKSAEKLLEICGGRDVVSWTTVISGCVYNGEIERALEIFVRMQEDGFLPNEVTILSILHVCSEFNDWNSFRWIHGLIVKSEWCRDALVMNSLVEMYSTNGCFEEGIKVFCEFCFTGEGLYVTPETMATLLLQGCGPSGISKLGKEIHGYLTKHGFLPCTVVENSLVYIYGENNQLDCAYQLFTRLRNKDIISWNTMITCLVMNEQPSEALELLREVHAISARDNIFPDLSQC